LVYITKKIIRYFDRESLIVWWGNRRERYCWRHPVVDGRIILRWIFRKWDVLVWTGSSWLRIGIGGGSSLVAVMNLRVP